MGVAQQKNKDVVFPKRGKKVNFEFESAVLARCMELVVSKALQSSETLPTDDGKPAFTAEVLASVLYKYDVVVLAAKEELKEKRWDTNKAVKKCVILYLNYVIYFFWLYLHSSLNRHRFYSLRLSRGSSLFSSAFALPASELSTWRSRIDLMLRPYKK